MGRVLHIIPYYNLFPPKNGGHLRCFHLMDQMARFHQVDVICYQRGESIQEAGYSNINVRFFNPESFRRKDLWKFLPLKIQNALRYRFLRRSVKGPAGAAVLDFAHIIMFLSKETVYDLVVFEHISTMLLSPLLKRLMPRTRKILDAHNIDSRLSKDRNTRFIESQLFKHVDGFWGCSKNDVQELEKMNQFKIKGTVVPNGVDSKVKPFVDDKLGIENKLIFCGSLDYYPNKEGLLWFYNEVWPLIIQVARGVEWTIIGRGDLAPFEYLKSDPRINLVGEVDDVKPYYREAYISIVPLLSGSGTRLKILEAMSFGNPVVTTSKGIEGIEAENNRESIIADDGISFAYGVISIIQKPEIGEFIRKNALKLINEKYDWDLIGSMIV